MTTTNKAKRIDGIGTITMGGALILTIDATKASGHAAPEGVSIETPAAQRLRRVITQHAQAFARALGRPVEVHATARGKASWVVDVVEPETGSDLGYMQGRGAA